MLFSHEWQVGLRQQPRIAWGIKADEPSDGRLFASLPRARHVRHWHRMDMPPQSSLVCCWEKNGPSPDPAEVRVRPISEVGPSRNTARRALIGWLKWPI